MTLPVKTTTDDVIQILDYLKTKGAGVNIESAKDVIDARLLDGRKIAAYRYWNMIEKDGDKITLSDNGWRVARKPEEIKTVFREVVQTLAPYYAVLEFAHFKDLDELTNNDVVALWSKKFANEVGENEEAIKDQVACFFRFCEGAGLGQMKVGRHSSPTRLQIATEQLAELIQGKVPVGVPVTMFTEPMNPKTLRAASQVSESAPKDSGADVDLPRQPVQADSKQEKKETQDSGYSDELKSRIYITHGKNRNLINSIKEILGYGELEPVVSVEEPTVAIPIPNKVIDEMRSCGGAIIHVDDDQRVEDSTGKSIIILNSNVLIEIGAAMALYGRRFILLVKEGVTLPSNLQGLNETRYSGDSLDGETTIRLLKAVNKLKIERIPD
jgi:predicted nucleotide-binding protein